jgi:hypothetical protein
MVRETKENMKILRMNNGFGDPDRWKADFIMSIKPFLGKQVLFRGYNEPRQFWSGVLSNIDGDTITFAGSATYPYWEVLIAVEETIDENITCSN